MFYKHIFTPHNAIIWSIRCIQHDRIWIEKRLWATLHLMDEDVNINKVI